MEFNKNFSSYNDNAIVQRKVAVKLGEMIKKNYSITNFEKVLELGCGTGMFTREFLSHFAPKILHCNDYFSCENFLPKISTIKFIQGDMKDIIEDNYDIIISSSSFQWIENLDKFFCRLSNKTNKLAFSIYTEGNLKEIKEHFNVGLEYKTNEFILKKLKKYFSKVEFQSEEFSLDFDTPLEALRHIKKTGVSLNKKTSINLIRGYKNKNLTYSAGYFICEK